MLVEVESVRPGKQFSPNIFLGGKHAGNVSAEVCPINPYRGSEGVYIYKVGLPIERLLTSKRLMAFVKRIIIATREKYREHAKKKLEYVLFSHDFASINKNIYFIPNINTLRPLFSK